MKRLQLSQLVTGVVIGGLTVGGLAPLIGADRETTAQSTAPGFLTEGGVGAPSGSAEGSAGIDGSSAALDGSTGAGPVGVTSADGTSADGSSVAGDPSSSAAAASTAEPKRASDVGITADTIRVGSFAVNCKSCPAIGAEVNVDDPPNRDIAVAFANEINARGGIHGRRLELFTFDYDPVDDAVSGGGTQRAGCLELTENRKVFAVLSGPTDGAPCVYEEHKTLLISNGTAGGLDPDAFNRNEGRLWITQPTNERAVYDWGRQIVAQKLFPPSAKWGIVLSGDGEADSKLPDSLMLPYLKEHGYTPTHISRLAPDFSARPVSVAREISAMRTKGVTHVLIGVPPIGGGDFWVREAERNGWKPQYLISDYIFGGGEYMADSLEAAGDWNGAIHVSQSRYYHEPELRGQLHPVDKRCLDIWEKASGRKTSETQHEFVFESCNFFRIFELAMNKAGVNPTRQSLSKALATLGQFPMAGALQNAGSFGGPYAFGPVKWSAAINGQRSVYRKPCPRPGNRREGCYVAEGPVYPFAG